MKTLVDTMTERHRLEMGAIVAGCVCVGVGAVVSILGAKGSRWSADLTAALYWTVPLGLLVGGVYWGWLRVVRIDRVFAFVGLLLLGPSLGFVWAFVVRIVLGGWYYAFGYNVLLMWCGSATAGLIAGWWVHKVASLSTQPN